jgi:hypothetical protein
VHLCHLWTTLPISRMKNSPQMTQMTQMKKSARLRQSINEPLILQSHALFLICVHLCHLCHLWTTLPVRRKKNSPQMTQMNTDEEIIEASAVNQRVTNPSKSCVISYLCASVSSVDNSSDQPNEE